MLTLQQALASLGYHTYAHSTLTKYCERCLAVHSYDSLEVMANRLSRHIKRELVLSAESANYDMAMVYYWREIHYVPAVAPVEIEDDHED